MDSIIRYFYLQMQENIIYTLVVWHVYKSSLAVICHLHVSGSALEGNADEWVSLLYFSKAKAGVKEPLLCFTSLWSSRTHSSLNDV